LLYHGGQYQWIRYKTYANTEGKLMARLTDFHRQHVSSSGPIHVRFYGPGLFCCLLAQLWMCM
jgi:hypothetical protein